MARTAMASALIKAGMNPADYAFGAACQAYKRAGGSAERGLEIFKDIFGLPGEGLLNCADARGHSGIAPSRQAVEDAAGRMQNAGDGHSTVAPASSSNRGGEGLGPDVRPDLAESVLPVRDASTKRGLTSITSIQSTIKQGLIELKKTHDGRAWGSVGWHELDSMDRDGAIARLIKQQVNPPKTQFAQLRSFISNKQFEEIVNAAQKQNDFV